MKTSHYVLIHQDSVINIQLCYVPCDGIWWAMSVLTIFLPVKNAIKNHRVLLYLVRSVDALHIKHDTSLLQKTGHNQFTEAQLQSISILMAYFLIFPI